MRIVKTILGASALFLSQANNTFAQLETQPQNQISEPSSENTNTNRFEVNNAKTWAEIAIKNRRPILDEAEEIRRMEITNPTNSTPEPEDSNSILLLYALLVFFGLGLSVDVIKSINDALNLKKGILNLEGFSDKIRLYPADSELNPVVFSLKDLHSIRNVIKQLQKYSPDFKDFFQDVPEDRIIALVPTPGNRLTFTDTESDYGIDDSYIPIGTNDRKQLISLIFSTNEWEITSLDQVTEVGVDGKARLLPRAKIQLSKDEAMLYRLCLEARKICSTPDGIRSVDSRANKVLVLYWMRLLDHCTDKNEKALLEKLISVGKHCVRIIDKDINRGINYDRIWLN